MMDISVCIIYTKVARTVTAPVLQKKQTTDFEQPHLFMFASVVPAPAPNLSRTPCAVDHCEPNSRLRIIETKKGQQYGVCIYMRVEYVHVYIMSRGRLKLRCLFACLVASWPVDVQHPLNLRSFPNPL